MRTPRTDAGTKHLRTWWSDSEPGDTEMVKAELARQLETELAAMTKAKDQWQGMFHEVVKQRDTEREKVAKLSSAADVGLGYAQECLVSHDFALGRTTERNKRDAESIEEDIAAIKKALDETK